MKMSEDKICLRLQILYPTIHALFQAFFIHFDKHLKKKRKTFQQRRIPATSFGMLMPLCQVLEVCNVLILESI